MTIARLGKQLSTFALLATSFLVVSASLSASAESKARIVRLSEVEGSVQIDRKAGDGFDKAFINLPVIEGCKLKTGKDGRAEVEFEDGSALRLAPDSEVEFTRLALGDDGQKLDAVRLVSGTVYANLHPKGGRKNKGDNAGEKSGDQFLLKFADESVSVDESAHFRVALDSSSKAGSSKATVAVFKGKVNATSPAGQVEVADKHSATVESATIDSTKNAPVAQATFVLAKNYETEPTDTWDHQQSDYHDRYASAGGSSIRSPYGYGMSDLNYYGNFMSVAGYGNVWQPFFMGANWSPFQDGAFAFYPGAGYGFVSGYPWGWIPYNYGTWAFIPSHGWAWQPGTWNRTNGVVSAVNAPATTKIPTAPTGGHHTVIVGRGLSANPVAIASRRFTINPGSAGFGVPRGSIDHLDHISKTMNKTSRPVVVAAAPPTSSSQPTSSFGGGGSARGGSSAGSMGSAHRSSAPSAAPRSH
jgi:FecR protein